MASFVYTPFKTRLATGAVNWPTMDVRLILVMSNTTADTDQDAENIADITTLDEYTTGTGYSRPALTGESVEEDLANNRAELKAANTSFGATVAAGARQAVGMIVYQHVDGTAANDLTIMYIDSGGFPFAGASGPVNVTWNSEGIGQVA